MGEHRVYCQYIGNYCFVLNNIVYWLDIPQYILTIITSKHFVHYGAYIFHRYWQNKFPPFHCYYLQYKNNISAMCFTANIFVLKSNFCIMNFYCKYIQWILVHCKKFSASCPVTWPSLNIIFNHIIKDIRPNYWPHYGQNKLRLLLCIHSQYKLSNVWTVCCKSSKMYLTNNGISMDISLMKYQYWHLIPY